MKNLNYLVVLVAGLSASIASAQSSASGMPEPVTARSQTTSQYSSGGELRSHTKNDIVYLCGGIGNGEASKMKAAASKFDLMVTFAASSGAYLADVNVDIADSKGQSVFSEKCEGPILLVDFPKGGTYKVSAEVAGKTLTRSARLSEKGSVKRISMTWPTDIVDMGLTPTVNGNVARESMRGGRADAVPDSASGSK